MNTMCIPEEVVYHHILVCLPVKSLLRFKSVSRSWLFILQSRSFIDLYHRRHRHGYRDHIVVSAAPSVFWDCAGPSTPPTSDFMFKGIDVVFPAEITEPEPVSLRVLGPTCNGIYCLIATPRHSDNPEKIAFYNPVTRQCKLANPSPCSRWTGLDHGFGVVSNGNSRDYKVVVVMNRKSILQGFSGFVYSLSLGTWRNLPFNVEISYICLCIGSCPQGFLNGSWHWTALDCSPDKSYVVLSFDMKNDVFKLIRGPSGHSARIHAGYPIVKGGVLVLNDHLSAIFYSRPHHTIGVWMMMEYGVEESWTKIQTFKLDPDFDHFYFGNFLGISSSLRSRDDGGLQIHRIFFQDVTATARLVSCDDSGKTSVHGNYNRKNNICWNILGVSSYAETLEPL